MFIIGHNSSSFVTNMKNLFKIMRIISSLKYSLVVLGVIYPCGVKSQKHHALTLSGIGESLKPFGTSEEQLH